MLWGIVGLTFVHYKKGSFTIDYGKCVIYIYKNTKRQNNVMLIVIMNKKGSGSKYFLCKLRISDRTKVTNFQFRVNDFLTLKTLAIPCP